MVNSNLPSLRPISIIQPAYEENYLNLDNIDKTLATGYSWVNQKNNLTYMKLCKTIVEIQKNPGINLSISKKISKHVVDSSFCTLKKKFTKVLC